MHPNAAHPSLKMAARSAAVRRAPTRRSISAFVTGALHRYRGDRAVLYGDSAADYRAAERAGREWMDENAAVEFECGCCGHVGRAAPK